MSLLILRSPTSQLILQPFCRFTYITAHSPTLMLVHLRHSSFSNHSFASPTSQAIHLIHLVSRPCSYLMCPLFYCSKYGNPSSTLAVSVPITITIKLGFVSVNGPRESYFVDAWTLPVCVAWLSTPTGAQGRRSARNSFSEDITMYQRRFSRPENLTECPVLTQSLTNRCFKNLLLESVPIA